MNKYSFHVFSACKSQGMDKKNYFPLLKDAESYLKSAGINYVYRLKLQAAKQMAIFDIGNKYFFPHFLS